MCRLRLRAWIGLVVAFALCLPMVASAVPAAAAEVAPEPLPAADPLAFLQKCLEHYDPMHIQSYQLVFQKQERVNGTLEPTEVIEVFFRAHPFSVFMRWLQGARAANEVLYVQGENGGKLLAHPTGIAGLFVRYVARDVEGPDAQAEGRYSIKDVGLKATLQRTLRDWKAAKQHGARQEYLGVRKVPEAGNQRCYMLRQTSPVPDAEGVSETTVYIDTENWFQVGTVLRDAAGQLLGDYYYRDIQLNPHFSPDQFQPSALSR
jgi:hypothetical protein